MDRNYGGVFIIWDRLFGTFQEEDDNEPVVFGVTTPPGQLGPGVGQSAVLCPVADDARCMRLLAAT